MTTTLEVTQEHVACWCGLAFMVPANLVRNIRENCDHVPKLQPDVIYCPLGHTFTYGAQTAIKDLRDQLTRANARLDQERSRAAEAEAKLRTATGKLKRVEKGTCPECHRHFANVRKHMATKHAPKAAT